MCFSTFFQSKLDDYQAKKNKGERLNQDQLVSYDKGNLEAAFYCSLLQFECNEMWCNKL